MRWPRLGTRDELLILLPSALLILVTLSTFLAFAYRQAIEALLAERREEAERWARRVAVELQGEAPRLEVLRRAVPSARAVSVFDSGGRLVAATDRVAAGAAEEPGTVPGSAVVGGPRGWTVRVDLPAASLLRRQAALRLLVPVVLVVNVGVSLMVLLFLRRVLAPFERLLARARARQETSSEGDEVALLIAIFERAVEQLSEPEGRDELAVLERTLARSLENGVLLCDHRGRLLALNDSGAAILGVARPSPGAAVSEVLAPHPGFAALLERAVERREAVQRQECRLEGEAGGRTLGLTVHPLRRDDGEVRGYLALFADLTETLREADERRLAESLAQLGELAAGVAHELRNGVASIRGYLTLVERGGGAEALAEYVGELRRETDHLQRVVEDFLSFARPGSARMETLDLAAVVHRAAADPALGGMAIDVKGGPAKVAGDLQLLERALRNLLHNAAEAERGAGGEGPVGVTIEVAPREVVVTIADRGPGLPADPERLFRPFVTGRPGGVGLGLALTHRIVELHRGSLRLEAREGGGVRAIVVLPAVASAAVASVTNRNDRGSQVTAAEPSD